MPNDKGRWRGVGAVAVVATALYLPVSVLALLSPARQPVAAQGQLSAESAGRVPTRENAPPNAATPLSRQVAGKFPTLLREYLGVPPESAPSVDTVAGLRDRAKDLGVSVEFLIALVPDPIDSYERWIFDPVMEAIQRGAADSNFLLDRFYMPDGEGFIPARRKDAPTWIEHETHPAVVFFRRERDPERTDVNLETVLVVFLVPETATFGIPIAPFIEASTSIAEWQGTGTPLRVLGPYFSGSVSSLRHAIQVFRSNLSSARYRVVSGSATRMRNQRDLESVGDDAVTFRATVLPDEAMLPALGRYLDTILPGRTADRVATFRESNTGYGSNLGRSGRHGENRPRAADAAWLSSVKTFTFPLHISRLRSAAEATRQQGAAGAQQLPGRIVAVPLGQDASQNVDQIPSASPELTSSVVDLDLAASLGAMTREKIVAVGLLATDTRDKLFLADEINRAGNDVMLFTLEGDLLLAHPDFAAALRGAVVASSYPLFDQPGGWTDAARQPVRRFQFPTTNAEGVYNATLALLDYDEHGNARSNAPPLVDYKLQAGGGDTTGGPAAWMSVVASGGLWPVTVERVDDRGYCFRPGPPAPPARAGSVDTSRTYMPSFLAPLSANAFVAALTIFCLVHAAAYWGSRTRRPIGWPLFRLFGRPESSDVQGFNVMTAFFALAVGLGSIAALAPLGLVVRSGDPWFIADAVVVYGVTAVLAVSALVALASTLRAVRRCLRTAPAAGGSAAAFASSVASWFADVRPRPAAAEAAAGGGTVSRLVCGLVAALALGAALVWTATLVFLGWDAVARAAYDAEAVSLLRFERAAHALAGVSPVVPLLLISAPAYLWAALRIAGSRNDLRSLTRWLTANPDVVALDGDLDEPGTAAAFVRGWASAMERLVERPMAALPAGTLAAVLAAFVASLLVLSIRRAITIESSHFSVAFSLAWAGVELILLLAVARAIHLWLHLRVLLETLGRHPACGAYARLPKQLFGGRLFSQPHSTRDEQWAVSQVPALVHRLKAAPPREHWASSIVQPSSEDAGGTSLLGEVTLVANRLVTRLATDAWRQGGVEVASSDATRSGDLQAENLAVVPVVFLVRDVLARISDTMFFMVAAVLLMIAAQASFPFRPRGQFLGFAWLDMALVLGTALAIYVQSERDAVLSHLWDTTPGKVTWDWPFAARMFATVVVPLLTLFAVQFPETGSALLNWVEPVRKALP